MASRYRNKLLFIAGIISMSLAQATTIEKAIASNPTDNPVVITPSCRLLNYEVNFDVKRGKSIVGSATRQLIKSEEEGNVQVLTDLAVSKVFMKFIQKERSVFDQYAHEGFYSSEYSKYTKRPFKKAVNQTYIVNDKLENIDSPLLDPLSVYEHLRELTCSGLRGNIELSVKDEDEVTQYYFKYKGEHALPLKTGITQTHLFVRTRKTSDRETSIWFSTENHFVPVKIQQEKDGKTQAMLIANSIDAKTMKVKVL